MSILAESFVLSAIETERNGEQFPIDFDEVWEALEYSRKDAAVRALQNKLEENIDFVSLHIKVERDTGASGKILYRLSIEALKMFCMMAETQKGREVRQYFISIEKAYRAQLEAQFAAPVAPSNPFPIKD
jgi:phage anti-repressor protein